MITPIAINAKKSSFSSIRIILTNKELVQKLNWRLDELITALAIPKKETMKYKLIRKSANDNRLSSHTIGSVGVQLS